MLSSQKGLSVFQAECGFSHKLVSACLAATSEVRSVCIGVCEMCTRVCVWHGVSKRQSNLIHRLKEGDALPCL